MKNEFGQYVKKIRESKNLSLADVAVESGISTSQISRIENGQRGVPKPSTINNLAKGLKVPYEELMEKAGYFKGMSDEKLQGVKDFFAIHRELDRKIEKYIDALCIENKLYKGAIHSLEKLVEKYIDDVGEDAVYTPEKLKGIIKNADFSEDVKDEFARKLEEIVLENLNKINSEPFPGTEYIEIQNFENYKFTYEGKELNPDEVLRLKELVLTGLKMLRS